MDLNSLIENSLSEIMEELKLDLKNTILSNNTVLKLFLLLIIERYKSNKGQIQSDSSLNEEELSSLVESQNRILSLLTNNEIDGGE